MSIFVMVIVQIIIPMFLLIGAGVFLHRKFHFHLKTFSNLLVYFLLPIVCFMNIYEADTSGKVIGHVLLYLFIFNAVLIGMTSFICKWFRFDRSLASTFKNSSVLSNSANYGLPVSSLVFVNNPLGLSIQIIVAIAQNILTYTWGYYNVIYASVKGKKDIYIKILKLPILYALILGLMFKFFSIPIPTFILTPLENADHAFLAVALLTLGGQIAYIEIKSISKMVIFSSLFRIVISPLVGLSIILLLKMDGVLAQALFISSAFPSNRSASLLALEYDNYPEIASSVVIITTLSSCFSVAVVIYLSKIIFP